MLKIIGFLIIAVLILYLGFREEKPRMESGTSKAVTESISPKNEQPKETATVQKAKVAMSGQETVETAEPIASNDIESDEETVETAESVDDEVLVDEAADDKAVADAKSDKESVTDNEKADEKPQEEKRKLVGGAEVEWIENPNPPPSDSKFARPPIY